MDDLLSEFLTETNESIDVVDVELVRLEQNPNDKEVLDNIFRLVHTIKGTCGFLGLPRLEGVAHSSENVLGKFRDGELEVTNDAVTLILASLDRIKEIMAGLEQTEAEPDGDDSDLIGQLDAWAETGTVSSGAAAQIEPEAQATPEPEISAPAVPEAAPPVLEESPAPSGDEDAFDAGLGRALKPGEVSLDELEAAFASAPGPDDLSDDAAAAPSKESTLPATDDDALADFGGHAGVAGAFESVLEQIGLSGKYPALNDSVKLIALAQDLASFVLAAFL
ncbi:MAG: Hpt domain-containing protein, partial [Pseudomonadota bacterium]